MNIRRKMVLEDFKLKSPLPDEGVFSPSLEINTGYDLFNEEFSDNAKRNYIPFILVIFYIGGPLISFPAIFAFHNYSLFYLISGFLMVAGSIIAFWDFKRFSSEKALKTNWGVISELKDYELTRFKLWAAKNYGVNITEDSVLRQFVLQLPDLAKIPGEEFHFYTEGSIQYSAVWDVQENGIRLLANNKHIISQLSG